MKSPMSLMILLMFGTVFVGCGGKKARLLFDRLQQRSGLYASLQQSQKAVFDPGSDHEAIWIVVYRPRYDDGYESFDIACYPDCDPGSQLRLEGTSRAPVVGDLPRSEASQALRKGAPSWFRLYRVRFPRSASSLLHLLISEERATRRLNFYRDAKYLHTKRSPLSL